MTREEEIQKLIDKETGIDNYGSSDYQVGVCDGVRLADKTMIDRACEWLKSRLNYVEDYIGDLQVCSVDDETVEEFIIGRCGMKLYIGEYEVPNDCRAMVSSGKVYVFRRITSKGRPKSTSLHCKDCEHRILGVACSVSNHKTYICELHPKTGYNSRKKLFYAASEYGKICANFKKKEL